MKFFSSNKITALFIHLFITLEICKIATWMYEHTTAILANGKLFQSDSIMGKNFSNRLKLNAEITDNTKQDQTLYVKMHIKYIASNKTCER